MADSSLEPPSGPTTPTAPQGDQESLSIGNLAPNPAGTNTLRELINIEENALSAARLSLGPALLAVSAAQARVSILQAELASEQYTLKLAQETASRIERMILELEDSINQRRGLLHPLRRVPVEILREIFIWRVEEEEHARRRAVAAASKLADFSLRGPFSPTPGYRVEFFPVAAALVLTAVCQHWRQVARETPCLWKYIYCSLSGQPQPSHHDVWRTCQSLAARSSGLGRPLDLVLEGWEEGGHPPPVHRVECVVNVLIGHALDMRRAEDGEGTTGRDLMTLDENPEATIAAKRASFEIGRMEVSFRRAPFGERRSWSEQYPVPQELVLVNTSGQDQVNVPPYMASLIPQVKKIAFVGMKVQWSASVDYRNLQSISLDTVSAQDLNACLQVCKNSLRNLELHGVEAGLEHIWPMVRLEKLESCTMTLQTMLDHRVTLSMPNLQRLTLLNLNARRPQLESIVQAYIAAHMPDVKELRVCAGRVVSQSESLADRIASIITTASNSPLEPPTNLAKLLFIFDNLSTLTLEAPAVGPVLMDWSTLPSETHGSYWSKLESLSLEGDLTDTDIGHLRNILERRGEVGKSGFTHTNHPLTLNGLPVSELIARYDFRGKSH